MKLNLIISLGICTIGIAGCSRSDDTKADSAKPKQNQAKELQADADRLQQATANVAKEKDRTQPQQSSATPTPPQQ